MNYGKGYRDCIKRNVDKTRKQSTCYIVTSCHGNNDEMWSTSYLIMQHKPYTEITNGSEVPKKMGHNYCNSDNPRDGSLLLDL